MKRGIVIGIIGIFVIGVAIGIDSLKDETPTALPTGSQAPEQEPVSSSQDSSRDDPAPVSRESSSGMLSEDAKTVSSAQERASEQTSTEQIPEQQTGKEKPPTEQGSSYLTGKLLPKGQDVAKAPGAEKASSNALEIPESFIKPPEFTVLRVNPEGDAVIAGRAMAHAKVIIRKDNIPLGEAKVDVRGEWVFIPPSAIPPGHHRIDLLEVAPDGSEQRSEAEILVVVAKAGEDIAGNPSDRPVKPLAMAVPRDGEEGPSSILQAPQAPLKQPQERDDVAEEAASTELKQDTKINTPMPKAEPEKLQIRLSNVDVAEDGKVHIVGFTEAGEALRLYIDNKPQAEAVADEAGRFQFAPKENLPKGKTMLRVDVVAAQGDVLARAEAEITVPPVEATGSSWAGSIEIKPGQNLWTIARQTYGRGLHYTIIFNANQTQIRDPNLIYPGQVFSLPKPEDLQQQ